MEYSHPFPNANQFSTHWLQTHSNEMTHFKFPFFFCLFVFSECGMPVTSSDVNYCIGHPPYTMSVDSTLTSLNRKIYQEILISFKEQFSDHNTELCGWATKALIPPVLPSQLEKDCHNNLSYFISF